MTIRTALAAAVATCAVGGSANATVVTFDDLPFVGYPNTAALPTGYGGITWNSDWAYYSWDQPPYTAGSPPSRVGDVTHIQSNLPFSFASPKVFQGADFAGGAGVENSFVMLLGGVVVATSSTEVLSATPTFLASGYSGNVDEVMVHTTVVGHWVMDDVTYTNAVTSAPEPSAWSLMLIGVFGVGARVRAKSRKVVA